MKGLDKNYSHEEDWVTESLDLLLQGHTTEEAEKYLISLGLEETSAVCYVEEAEEMLLQIVEDYEKEEIRRRGHSDMLWGAVWAIGGGVITFFSYESAAGGGTYFVFYGAIIYGLIKFIGGIIKAAE